jgi:hypothetical protein
MSSKVQDSHQKTYNIFIITKLKVVLYDEVLVSELDVNIRKHVEKAGWLTSLSHIYQVDLS